MGGYKSDEFSEKLQRGRGVIFNPKNYIADIGNFKQGFLSMKFHFSHCSAQEAYKIWPEVVDVCKPFNLLNRRWVDKIFICL